MGFFGKLKKDLELIKSKEIKQEAEEQRQKRLASGRTPKAIAKRKAIREAHDKKPEVIAKHESDRLTYFRSHVVKEGKLNLVYHLKLEVFSHYSKIISNSDIPICACCGYSDLRFLVLDHIDGRKNLSEYEKKLNGSNLYAMCRDSGFPKGYQVLCHNCNNAKGDRAYCPHQLDKMKK